MIRTWLDWFLQGSKFIMEVVIIGVGGVGGELVEHLSRILSFGSPFSKIKIIKVLLIDGDSYELRNADRQKIPKIGNKAIVQAEFLSQLFPRILFGAIPLFVGKKNSRSEIAVESVVKESRIIFLCPDNGKTRKLVHDRCANLKNSVLICGGNDDFDGYGHLYLRKEGKDVTPPIVWMNPSVAEPRDKSPAEIGCDELLEAKPQLYLANLDVAQSMLILFYSLVTTPLEKHIPLFRIYCDVTTGKRRVETNKP